MIRTRTLQFVRKKKSLIGNIKIDIEAVEYKKMDRLMMQKSNGLKSRERSSVMLFWQRQQQSRGRYS
jgi:hypothetical protein